MVMIKKHIISLVIAIIATFLLSVKDIIACTGGTLAGNITPGSNWQTISGVQAGDYFTFTIGTNEVIIFSFCQGGGSYMNDPRIEIMNNTATMSITFNDDHCGYGSELIWVCPATGTYTVGFYQFGCLTNGTALGTVAYKLMPTPTEQDCLGARPLCTSFTNHPQSYSGIGHYYDIYNFYELQGMPVPTDNCPNCLVTGERNNVWYTFTAQTAGNLAFTITPHVSSDDYDWALYSLNGGVTCLDLIDWAAHPPVSCNYSYGGSGTTGIGAAGSSNCVGPVEDVLWNSTFPIAAGSTYALIVSNFSSTQNGYTINFGASTTQILDNVGPSLQSVVYPPYCGSPSLTIQFSEGVWCQSIQPSDFQLIGPNGTYSIINTYSAVCMAASSNTYSGTWYDNIWTLELGDYLSNPGDYSLILIPGTVTDKCDNTNIGSLLQFTITGLSADVDIISLAGCDGQSNGSISVSNFSGGTAPYSVQWSGPNGFTSTATTISNLEAGTYTVTVTDIDGICEYVESVDLTGYPAINPTASNNGPLCEGSTLNLTGGSSVTGVSYSWSGPDGFTSNQQNPSRTNADINMSGTYSLTVTDSHGCTAIAQTDVIVYDVQNVSITTSSPYCQGDDITLNATTIVGASYSWTGPNGFTSNNEDPIITNAQTTDSGLYSVTVTDANSCTATASTNVIVNPAVNATLTGIDPLCHGQATGQISVSVTSGTAPYSFTWNNGSNNNPLNNIPGGVNYCVTIQDATGCSFSACHTLTDPSAIVADVSTVPTQCGYLQGEINVTVSGGAGGYTAQWTEGHSGLNITGLHPGNYSGTITDANGCQLVVSANVGFFGAGTASVTQLQDVKCYGQTTAVLQADMTDATAPLTYTWSVAGQTTQTISNLGAGTYSVTISDVYGCTGSATHTVTQPTELSTNMQTTNVLCKNGNNGNATVTAEGGVPPYIFNWSNGSASSHISSLTAGTYIVTVTDLNGCSTTNTAVITQPDKDVNLLLSTTDVSCAGRYDGIAIATGDGGTAPYLVYWYQFGQLLATGSQVTSLRSGNYSVEIFDANLCKASANFTINEPSEMSIGSEMHQVSCRGFNDGMISVSVVGGTQPYTYKWNTGDTVHVVNNLKAGQYFITISDANGCNKTLGIMIPENPKLCLGIPDAFTPNGDGINDTWIIEYIEMYPAAVVNVFNRWGQLLYQGRSGSDPWDGKYKDKFVPAGAYQYVIDLRNGMEPFTGVVVVIY